MMIRTLALAVFALSLLGCAAVPSPARAAGTDTLTVTLTTPNAAACASGCSALVSGPVNVSVMPLIVSTYQSQCNAFAGVTCTPAQTLQYMVKIIGRNLTQDIAAAQQAAALSAAQAAVVAPPIQ